MSAPATGTRRTPPRLGRAAAIAACLVVVLAGLACGPGKPRSARRNFILISIDSLRADHLGAYGYAPPTSPSLDALARKSVVFERAYAPSPWTLPSHVSLFTGLNPAAHGVDHGQAHLDESATTLADLMRERGYWTGAVVCAPLLRKRFGLDQGFDLYDVDLVGKNYLEARRTRLADKVTDRALAAIDGAGDRPFFLFLHYWDPHYDYTPPPGYLEMFDRGYEGKVDGLDIHDRTDLASGMDPRDLRHLIALYDAEIRFTDDQIGRLLEGLSRRGRDADTAVIVTADHGEEFLEHGGTGHTHTCYEEVLRIPLVVHVPWLAQGPKRVAAHASLLDLFPTVADLARVSREGLPLQGVSLLPELDGTGALPPRFLMAETRMGQLAGKHGNMSSLLAPDELKFIFFESAEPRGFLFDLGRDPGETTDLSGERSGIADDFFARLSSAHGENRRWNEAIRVGREDALEPELSETLKGLGYLQSGSGGR